MEIKSNYTGGGMKHEKRMHSNNSKIIFSVHCNFAEKNWSRKIASLSRINDWEVLKTSMKTKLTTCSRQVIKNSIQNVKVRILHRFTCDSRPI